MIYPHRPVTHRPPLTFTARQRWPVVATRISESAGRMSIRGGPWTLFAGAAFAQTSAVDAPGLSAGVLLQTLFSLVLVVGLILAAAYLVRKVNGGRGFGGNGPLRIVGSLLLGPRERIVLLEIGDTWLIVGVTAGRMQTLHTLPKGKLYDGAPDDKQFAQWLKRIGERNNEDH